MPIVCMPRKRFIGIPAALIKAIIIEIIANTTVYSRKDIAAGFISNRMIMTSVIPEKHGA